MNSTELMTGDLVSCGERGYGKVCLLVKSHFFIDKRMHDVKEEIAVDLGNGKVVQYFNTGSVTPIPITSEFLTANGFVRKGMFWENEGVVLQPHIDAPFCLITKVEGLQMSLPCYHIHTLQHALRLCGMDGLADSFKAV